ncbi:dnaJ homolog subfamily C member 9 [Anas acuta]|uniref:dnaJ homolog subfamily C member 9 n=1 Tax=Anas acuta TaxID=28680 RepID=UPI0035C8920D
MRGGGGAMGLLEQCEAAFGAADLYRALGVRRGASPEEIRRGYHRASLRVHPDRVPPEDKEEATRRFQILGKAYAVLSDAEQRALYDEQGRVDEEGEALRAERDWQEYWRLLFKKISVKDIEDFEKTYKDSEQELADVKAAYMDFEGDMDKIMESVLCVDYTDEPRIRKIIEKAIDLKEVPSYKAFVKEPKQKATARKRRAEKEAREAEKCKQELGLGDGEDDLKALIQSRNKDRKKEMDDFLSHLEAKYGNNPKKGGKKTAAKKGKK